MTLLLSMFLVVVVVAFIATIRKLANKGSIGVVSIGFVIGCVSVVVGVAMR